MELEEMKTLWNELSAKVDKQNLLTDKIILTMTQERYKNKFQKIKTFETIGTFVSAIFGIAMLLNIHKLDTWYLLTCGIYVAAHFLLLPPVVLASINRIKNISITNKNYKETLVAFTKAKHWLFFVQRLAIFLNFLLLLVSIPVAAKIINNKNLFEQDKNTWLWFLPIMVLILSLVSAWGYMWTKHNTIAAEDLIMDIDS